MVLGFEEGGGGGLEAVGFAATADGAGARVAGLGARCWRAGAALPGAAASSSAAEDEVVDGAPAGSTGVGPLAVCTGSVDGVVPGSAPAEGRRENSATLAIATSARAPSERARMGGRFVGVTMVYAHQAWALCSEAKCP